MQVIARASALLLALATASAIDGASSPCPPRAAQPWLFSPGGITEFHSGRDARPYRKMSHPFYV